MSNAVAFTDVQAHAPRKFRLQGNSGMRSASRIRVPNALRGPQEAAGRQGRRVLLVVTSWL